MYCHKCGKQVSSGDKFCNSCGVHIKNDELKIEQINSVKNNTNRKTLIVGITISIFIVLCLGVTYFKFINKSEDINAPQSTEAVSQNSTVDDISTTSEKTPDLTKETHKEKEVFAKLLKSKKWLTENTDYAKEPDFIKFLILDINQDGVCEMLLYHGDSGGLAGLTLSIVSYNVNEDKINAQKINVSHGGYKGYLSNKKIIVTDSMGFGVSYMYGYKLEGDRYINTFSSSDNTGGVGSENKIVYTLNDNNVSKEKYNQFIDPINTNLTYTEMYSINDENIRNVLGIEPSTFTDDKLLDRYSTLKFSTAEQAKDWLLTQDSTFLAKNNLRSIKESNNYGMVKTFFGYFAFEKDDYYLFDVAYMEGDEGEPMRYLVGKHTGNIYLVGPQPQEYAYLIKNNQVIEKLKYNNEKSTDWRNM